VFQILYEVSNNEAGHEALLHRLRLAVYNDSLLVIQQVNKEWDMNKDTMNTSQQVVQALFSNRHPYEVRSSQEWQRNTASNS
jgi:ribonuclease HI